MNPDDEIAFLHRQIEELRNYIRNYLIGDDKMIEYPFLNLKTGDVVLFSGKGFFSNIIKAVDGGDISHVGMIYRCPLTNACYISESTFLYKGANGVQLNLLGERVRTYKGSIYVRQLSSEVAAWQLSLFQQWIGENRHTSYESGLDGAWELFCAAVDFWPFENKPDPTQLFCSEKVAIIFKLWDFLPKDLTANEVSPNDFRDGINKILTGAQLEKAIQIK